MQRLLIVGSVLALAFSPMVMADCNVEPNAFRDANCGFTSDLSLWTTFLGTGTWSSDGMPVTGSLEVQGENVGFGMYPYQSLSTSSCVSAASLVGVTTFAVNHRLMSGSVFSCDAHFNYYVDAACSAAPAGIVLTFYPGPSWGQVTAASSTLSGQGIKVDLRCYGGAPFTVRFDHVWAGTGTAVPVELLTFSVE